MFIGGDGGASGDGGWNSTPTPNNLLTERWKSFNLDVVRKVTAEANGGRYVVYGVGVPLSTEAVLVSVDGPEDRDLEVRAALRVVLDSFDGPPGWPEPGAFVLKNKHLVLAGCLLFVVLVTPIWVWRRRRPKRVIQVKGQ